MTVLCLCQVWDVLQEAPLSNYRGHVGYLLCVDWSPVDPDVVWTGGKDFTLQEWRVSQQEFTKPPKGLWRAAPETRSAHQNSLFQMKPVFLEPFFFLRNVRRVSLNSHRHQATMSGDSD